MRILVTGAAGFIGGSFARLAASRGHRVAGLIRPGNVPPPSSQEISWLTGTLEEAPWAEIDGFRPEACLHSAWVAAPGVYLESAENERLVRSSREFIRRAARAGARRIAALGTCLEYQMTGGLLAEPTTPLVPASLYARCKDALRRALEHDGGEFGFSFCWGRVFYPYGPGEHPERLCASLARKLLRGERVMLRTPGSVKDYIFIEDLASAILALVEGDVSGAVNLATGSGVTVRQVAETLGGLVGGPGMIEAADPPLPDPLPRVVADASRLRSLGWKPRVSLRDGLSRLVASLNP